MLRKTIYNKINATKLKKTVEVDGKIQNIANEFEFGTKQKAEKRSLSMREFQNSPEIKKKKLNELNNRNINKSVSQDQNNPNGSALQEFLNIFNLSGSYLDKQPHQISNENDIDPGFQDLNIEMFASQTRLDSFLGNNNFNGSSSNLTEEPDNSLKFNRKDKNSIEPISLNKGKWTEEEDQKLIILFNDYGKDWRLIALNIGTRTARQCMARYRNVLHTKNHSASVPLKKGKWTEEEDEKLRSLMEKFEKNWTKIAEGMENRSVKQCEARAKRLKSLNNS